ncbi:ATP-dependent DNA helicase homolog RECG, chloroplastic [Salvia miltiorrhiza]|uniref:ATP-dependent DNA helicase homolog RECG, chloroplastic n=1 Tax=Salvia miltiorrhiza TaxID=226208 RepID=UPI0025AC2AED|nr:ATP-dependent DNA helicase homolog RECG, chloroplastic [Salvia miltiorrhiza]XP_057765905.1 ATP-dependent DNA helicase homolog RECG, chloroplastic [Salvia miltiorrhiza]XP_057765906.1 ATP-dependent DNA helicase homolog RECG, chloroplastic [Salvia miltiorrhiza]
MAVTPSALQLCTMGFSDKCLRHAVNFEAERACRSIFGRCLRFNNFLAPNSLTSCFRSKHKFPEKLLKGLDGFEKESVFIGYNGLDGLIGNNISREKFRENFKVGSAEFDATLTCKQFPSISLGCFPTVELYDGPAYNTQTTESLVPQVLEGCIASRIDANLLDPNFIYQNMEALYAEISNMNMHQHHILEDDVNKSTNSQSHDLKTEPRNVLQLTADEPCSYAGSETQLPAVSVAVILDESINFIGLSRRQNSQLEKCGFYTLRKLLHHFPRTYVDLQNAEMDIDDGQYMIFVGKIMSSRGIRASSSFSYLEVIVASDIADIEANDNVTGTADDVERSKRTIYLHLKKFFRGARFTCMPFLRSIQGKHKEGDVVCVSGKVRKMRSKDNFEMREYSIDVVNNEGDSCVLAKGRPYPIYPSKKGLNSDVFRDIISRALKMLPAYHDPLPKDIIQDFHLPSLSDAYIGIHQPTSFRMADLARRRLIFDEFFYLQLGKLFQMLEGLGTKLEKDGLLERYIKPGLNTRLVEEWASITKNFVKVLPYTLTTSQLQATSEIIWDLKRPVPMNRLLQGDVGCGKTVVAFLSCMEVIGSGYQAAFMVPTELLAIQHYEHLLGLLEKIEDANAKPSVALLTGSTSTKQARFIRQGLQSGDISMVIGTHSLIAEKVEFSALRIAVVDEQHRFGVVQRGRFNSKLYFNNITSQLKSTSSSDSAKNDVSMAPHVLAMSATPIPRSLALALYGDMSLTQITDLPPGRSPIKTYVIEGNEVGFDKAYQMMLEELGGGGKVYLVYPVIEQSEQLPQLRAASADFEAISNKFCGYKCGLLHGRMKSDEKDEALRQFRSGETKILLSTQVIEVGVDVPDASMMVVMNAERFGIAQLHQLRGRVGRGERKSKCILMASTNSSLKRLKVLEESSDGFYLANMDLVLRGPGDLLGKKQSGHLPEFPVTRLEIDGNILQEAHVAALKVLESSYDLEKFPDLRAELSIRQPLCLLGD